MARIREFFRIESSGKLHPTEVECGYSVIGSGSGALLELRTYGSDNRVSAKKVSQTLQLDRAAAEQMIEIIADAFPGLV
jgi:hypothetical protein